MALTEKELYEQGSALCHQYSRLTMQVRMFSQQILVGYAAAIGVFLANIEDPKNQIVEEVLFGGGVVLFIFSTVLFFLNFHHSLAFRCIRDESLIELEKKLDVVGPWMAHERERRLRSVLSRIAWHGPFIAMAAMALVSIVYGVIR